MRDAGTHPASVVPAMDFYRDYKQAGFPGISESRLFCCKVTVVMREG